MQPSSIYTTLGKCAMRLVSTLDVLQIRPNRPVPGGRLPLLKRLPSRPATGPTQTASAAAQSTSGLDQLRGIVKMSHPTLAKASAIFPFDLFPDTLAIDRQKLTVVHRSFFNVEQTVSVQLADVTNIQANVGPFFGALTISSEHFINNTQTIKYVSRRNAIVIQHLLQGMIIAHKEHIDLDQIGNKELLRLLDDLGSGKV